MWDLYHNAKTWGTRPSVLLAIDDEYEAWCLDQAVFHFGNALEAELDAVEGKTSAEMQRKRQRILDRVLSGGKRKFADPASSFKKGG